MNSGKFVTTFQNASPTLSKKDIHSEILRSIRVHKDFQSIPDSHLLIIVVEELAELQKEITKELRGMGDRMHILEEIADVAIGIVYLQDILGLSTTDIYKAINVKIDRIHNVLDERGFYK